MYLYIPHLINPPHIPIHRISHKSPTYTYTPYISLFPLTYLQNPHLINPPHIPLSQHLIDPHIFLHSLHLINPHIHLHSLHLINPPHIPTKPTSHQSPRYTYTAYISLIPHIYLLINPPHISTD